MSGKTCFELGSYQIHEVFGGKFLGFLNYDADTTSNTATAGSGAPTSGFGKGALLVNLNKDSSSISTMQKIAINTGTEQACVWAEIIFSA